MTSCKDSLKTKKIEMTFHSIMESLSHLGKMARTSAKSENPNAPVVNRRVRGRSLSWITPTIKNLMKKRDYHHKKSIKTNKELHWSSCKRLRNVVSMKLRKEKASYYSNHLCENLTATSFNEFFTSVVEKLCGHYKSKTRLPDILTPRVAQNFVVQKVSTNFVLK